MPDESQVTERPPAPAGPVRSPLARDPAAATRRFPAEDRGRSLVWRGAFERDRDRIVHARAFRRLGDKSQLLPASDLLQVRTRLTHTLEVAALARGLCRHLGLDEDLAEVVALGHDLGQPPFGPAGGRALQRMLTEPLGRRLPRGAGPGAASPLDPAGFDPRAQALRAVDLIEVRYDHAGLNLTDDAREGLHKIERDDAPVPPGIDPAGLRAGQPGPLEAQAVRAAIAAVTPVHDVEDALGEGLLDLTEVRRLAGVEALVRRLEQARAWPRGRFRQHAALHRALVHALASDLLVASRRRLARAEEAGRVPAGRPVVAPGARGAELAAALREMVASRVIGRPAVRRADARAERIVEGLFASCYRDPRLLDDAVLLRYKELSGRSYLRDLPRARQEAEIAHAYHGRQAFARLLADHIAGMTDRYARAAWDALDPGRSES